MHPDLIADPEVADALAAGRPMVALESTLIAHGLPKPLNLETARAAEAAVRAAGAVPATVAILDGRIRVGLATGDMERLAEDPAVEKASLADLGALLAAGGSGATTVAATMLCAHLAGIRVCATGGIGGVHRGAASSFDVSADLDALGALGVPLVEDLAMSLGSRWRGKRTGGKGSLAVCSFYATKMMATGEGGMVLGGDEALLAEVRDLRAMDEKEEFRIRFNCKMTDLQAALGLSQLRKLAGFIARRREIADLYGDALRGSAACAQARASANPSWSATCSARRRRGSFIDEMKRRGLECRRPVYKPLHRYCGLSVRGLRGDLRNAVSVPLYPR
jgi:hypothetical protein